MKNNTSPADVYLTTADVHELQREQPGIILTLMGAVALLVTHGLNVYWVLWEIIPFSLALAIYFGTVVATLVIGRIFYMRDAENRFIVLLCMSSLVLGPIGAGGILIMLLLHAWFTRFSQSFAEWFDTIFPAVRLSKPEQIYENILIGRDEASKSYSVIPFMDVLSYGNETQKMQALSRMTSQFSPSFAPAFRRALADSSNTIRVQAATAISKIENQFLERLMKLTEIYRQHPRDSIAVLALASHYDDYAYTGILDADRETTNREKALVHYMEYLKLNPSDVDVRARIGRILLRNFEPQRAADWLAASIKEGYDSDAISLWYGEALYAAHRYTELRERSARMATQATKLQETQPILAEAYALWSQPVGSRV